jgi:hypothetical protein
MKKNECMDLWFSRVLDDVDLLKKLGVNYNWRSSGLLEWVCMHGVGHPVYSSTKYMDLLMGKGSKGSWGVHTCDGCCKKPPKGLYQKK